MTARTSPPPVTATDRVSDVLARDESLVEVFTRHAPHFAKLRNRAMRRVMARLVTVEQAARTAGVPVEVLIRDLNGALGLAVEPDGASTTVSGEAAPQAAGARESAGTRPARPAHAPVVELDVREDLRSGREPFSKIMAAVGSLGADEVLHLRAIFEPVPLFSVLGKRGFEHESREHAPDDWSVWFWRPPAERARRAGPPNGTSAPGGEAGRATAYPAPSDSSGTSGTSVAPTVWLDVRGLEPPDPLLRTLSALEALPAGHSLVQVNVRVPVVLLPMLAERGFACEIDESRADHVLVRIWKPS